MRCAVNNYYSILSGPDIYFVTVRCDFYRPYPYIGDIAVPRIKIQSAFDALFKCGAVFICGYRVVPTLHRFTVQYQTNLAGITLGEGYPIIDIEFRF